MRKGFHQFHIKKEELFDNNNVIMAKISENEDDNNNQKTIQNASAIVIVNKRITTLSILEIRPNQGNFNLNAAKTNRNIFSAMKLNDPTLKITTSQNVTIYTLLQLLEEKEYTSKFCHTIKCPQTSRIYITHKI